MNTLLQKAEQIFSSKPVIVMESTSHYHFIIFAVLRDQKPFELKTPEQHAAEQGFVKAA